MFKAIFQISNLRRSWSFGEVEFYSWTRTVIITAKLLYCSHKQLMLIPFSNFEVVHLHKRNATCTFKCLFPDNENHH